MDLGWWDRWDRPYLYHIHVAQPLAAMPYTSPMTLFQTVASIISLAALASYLNHRYVRLPTTMGLMVIGLVLSLGFVLLGKTGVIDVVHAANFVRDIDFSETLLHGMLAFLLFAGALHVDLS